MLDLFLGKCVWRFYNVPAKNTISTEWETYELVYWTIVADDAPLHTQQRERFEYFGLILVFRFCLLLCVFYFVFQQMLHQLLMLIQKAMHMRIMYKTRAENWQNSHNHNHSLGSLSHTWLSTLLWMMAIVMCDVYTFFSRSLAHSLSHCLRTYIFSSLCRTPRSIWDYSFIRLIDVLPIAEICHPEYSWNVNGLIAWNH